MNRNLPQNLLEMKKKYFLNKTAKFSYQFLPLYFVIMADAIKRISQNKKKKTFQFKMWKQVGLFLCQIKVWHFDFKGTAFFLFFFFLLFGDKKVAVFQSSLNFLSSERLTSRDFPIKDSTLLKRK